MKEGFGKFWQFVVRMWNVVTGLVFSKATWITAGNGIAFALDWLFDKILVPMFNFFGMLLGWLAIAFRFALGAGILVYFLRFSGIENGYILDDLHLYWLPLSVIIALASMGWSYTQNKTWLYGWMPIVLGYMIFQTSLLGKDVLAEIEYLFAEGIAVAMMTYAFATVYEMASKPFRNLTTRKETVPVFIYIITEMEDEE